MPRLRTSRSLAALAIAAMIGAPLSYAASLDAGPAVRTVASADAPASAAESKIAFLGTIFRWYQDPDCPYNPDSHEALKAYGYDNGNGPVITSVTPSGLTTYFCDGSYRGGVFDAPEPWIWNESASDPYWGTSSYFPYAWDPTECWGGGEPC